MASRQTSLASDTVTDATRLTRETAPAVEYYDFLLLCHKDDRPAVQKDLDEVKAGLLERNPGADYKDGFLDPVPGKIDVEIKPQLQSTRLVFPYMTETFVESTHHVLMFQDMVKLYRDHQNMYPKVIPWHTQHHRGRSYDGIAGFGEYGFDLEKKGENAFWKGLAEYIEESRKVRLEREEKEKEKQRKEFDVLDLAKQRKDADRRERQQDMGQELCNIYSTNSTPTEHHAPKPKEPKPE